MHRQPAALDRKFEARATLGRAAAVTEAKRLVDFLDVDAALNWLDRVRDLDRRGLFRGRRRGGRCRISCSSLVFLVRAARNNPDRIVRQGPLQRLGLIPRRASFGAGKSAVS